MVISERGLLVGPNEAGARAIPLVQSRLAASTNGEPASIFQLGPQMKTLTTQGLGSSAGLRRRTDENGEETPHDRHVAVWIVWIRDVLAFTS
jgi:hypothetical protein